MTYGTKIFKNGKIRGYLIFDTGKKIVLNNSENSDFKNKIENWQQEAVDKFINNNKTK